MFLSGWRIASQVREVCVDNQFKVVDDLLRCGVAGVDMHIIGGIDDVQVVLQYFIYSVNI